MLLQISIILKLKIFTMTKLHGIVQLEKQIKHTMIIIKGKIGKVILKIIFVHDFMMNKIQMMNKQQIMNKAHKKNKSQRMKKQHLTTLNNLIINKLVNRTSLFIGILLCQICSNKIFFLYSINQFCMKSAIFIYEVYKYTISL